MAGCKPSSTLLNLTLMEIAKHELVQEKIQMEIDFVLENYNYEITSESLYNMAYIDRVISGSLYLPFYFFTIPVFLYIIENRRHKILFY